MRHTYIRVHGPISKKERYAAYRVVDRFEPHPTLGYLSQVLTTDAGTKLYLNRYHVTCLCIREDTKQ